LDIETKFELLSQPSAFPFDVTHVEVFQTHISAVFVAGDRAYKIKKPVNFGFVDYSTLPRRKQFCEAEHALNSRLAPNVYLGVVPVVRSGDGLSFGGDGEVVDWAVEMVRLPESRNLKSMLEAGTVTADIMQELGGLLAEFHRDAEKGGEICAYGHKDTVFQNALDNFTQSADQVGVTVNAEVLQRLEALTRAEMDRVVDLVEARADVATCDTHGDLRLEHVYVLQEGLAVVDCIEFNDAFRYADPVADLAFLVMDLKFRWADDLAEVLIEAYEAAAHDGDGLDLLPFYVAYRSAVRAKVHGFRAVESEVPAEQREQARAHSAAHWLFALGTLAEPKDKPCILLTTGLPGTGKSTLSKRLVDAHGFHVLDSDVVRKSLAGIEDPLTSAKSKFNGGIYTAEWTERTYQALLESALEHVRRGERVVVDATFDKAAMRQQFLGAAKAAGVPAYVLECTLPTEVAKIRIDARTGNASDADWDVYLMKAKAREAYGESVSPRVFELDMVDPQSWQRELAAVLRELNLS
jgi:aminoglycoside phosphotransferase family enzyme/predicted kinase